MSAITVRDWLTAAVVAGIVLALMSIGIYPALYTHKAHAGQNVTITGPMPGVIFMYDSSGNPLVSYSCTILKGNTTTSGTFSLTGTAPTYNGMAQWTTPANAWVDDSNVVSASTAIAGAYTPYPVSITASSSSVTVTGTVFSPTTLIVLGATAVNATTAKPITIRVCSN